MMARLFAYWEEANQECDGFTVRFASYGESIFVCGASNQAAGLISSLKSYKLLGKKLGQRVGLFQLNQVWQRVWTADVMKGIERQAYYRTGRGCPQVPDLVLSIPTRDAFKILHSSLKKTKSFLSETDLLQHIAQDIWIPSFTTLNAEHFFAVMRSPNHSTPDMHDYDGYVRDYVLLNLYRRYFTLPFQCILDPKVTTRTKELRLFAKEFEQGVQQQRVRDRKKKRLEFSLWP